ncbi:MAG: phosphotransferase [Candidatus Bathyarchaeia archaeon]|jgi:Ser/Thr protein kinase RdoA (MazF antagonist)
MDPSFGSRIGYHDVLDNLSRKICNDFELGSFLGNELVLTGYEDFNFVLDTTRNRFFVKVFATSKTILDCKRYVDIMAKVIVSGVKTPSLIRTRNGYLNVLSLGQTNLRFCLLEYVDGKDFFNLSERPDDVAIRRVAQQAALINSIALRPPFVYDAWAVTNFKKEFDRKSKYLSLEDLRQLSSLYREFDHLKIRKLPHCFVHGDLVRTNIMKDRKGEIWIIDFSVSNTYPRIQEISVLASDFLFDSKNRSETRRKYRIALDEYQKTKPLTEFERKALPKYIKLAFGMHILLTTYEKSVNQNFSKETEHYLQLGRDGLRQLADDHDFFNEII